MSIVFLLGAGASYGSGNCTPHNPALGNGKDGLFKALVNFCPNGYFACIQKIKPNLSNIFVQDFEEGMEKLRNEECEDGTDLREMAKYFIQFQPQQGNLYHKLLQILGKKRQHCTFVTTNYDLLIELSARLLNLKCDYNNAVFTKSNNLKILKIHGSPNIWPDYGSGRLENIRFKGCKQNISASVKHINNLDEITALCREQNPGPVLAEYRRGKRVANCSKFTDKQVDLWKEAIKKASKCFIIGLRLNKEDIHIWEPLQTSHCDVYYYSPDKTCIHEILSWKERTNIYAIEKDFNHALNNIHSKLKP